MQGIVDTLAKRKGSGTKGVGFLSKRKLGNNNQQK